MRSVTTFQLKCFWPDHSGVVVSRSVSASWIRRRSPVVAARGLAAKGRASDKVAARQVILTSQASFLVWPIAACCRCRGRGSGQGIAAAYSDTQNFSDSARPVTASPAWTHCFAADATPHPSRSRAYRARESACSVVVNARVSGRSARAAVADLVPELFSWSGNRPVPSTFRRRHRRRTNNAPLPALLRVRWRATGCVPSSAAQLSGR